MLWVQVQRDEVRAADLDGGCFVPSELVLKTLVFAHLHSGALPGYGCGSKLRVGAPPILVYFSGDWDVHGGYGILSHGPMAIWKTGTGQRDGDQQLESLLGPGSKCCRSRPAKRSSGITCLCWTTCHGCKSPTKGGSGLKRISHQDAKVWGSSCWLRFGFPLKPSRREVPHFGAP